MFKEEKTRFFLEEDNQLVAEIKWNVLANGDLDVNGTFVDPSQRGKGLAEKLVLEVLEKAKKEDVKILPSCSYVAKYFENHPEVSDLLVK
ncbi:GNAT family N-acetyltransferase [Vagococcus fluvialis]|uniref:GNAT family N-acetyltransferase n=1 Tax=Vagococcus fluvialis TaxID=2738 RepID=UPI003B5C7DBA